MNHVYEPGGLVGATAVVTPAPITEELIEILDAAIETLQHGWCQYEGARDAAGDPVNAYAPHAVAWCASGAVCRAAYALAERLDRGDFWATIAAADALGPVDNVVVERYGIAWGVGLTHPTTTFNDRTDTTVEDVLQVFKEGREDLSRLA